MNSDSNSCPPEMNIDVSGFGVRISFYLQTLFLALLSVRSGEVAEATNSLLLLVATNIAMVVASLILGFKNNPEITLQDGLVVCYLLALSSITIYISFMRYDRFTNGNSFLDFLAVFQTYLLFAFIVALLVKGRSFGKSPNCNFEAVVVIFRPFSAIRSGRVVGWVVVSLALVAYSFLTIGGYAPAAKGAWTRFRESRTTQAAAEINLSTARPRGRSNQAGNPSPKAPSTSPRKTWIADADYTLIVVLIVISVIWSLAVMNTELLIRWNHFAPNHESKWTFGQLLPIFLVALPLMSVVEAFAKHKLSHIVHPGKIAKRRRHRVLNLPTVVSPEGRP